MKKIMSSGMALLIGIATPAMAANVSSSFQGHWRVAAVAVSEAGVQAMGDNDPSLMGKRLTFSPQRLAWDQPTITNDVCVGPTFTRLPIMPPADLRAQLHKLGMRKPVAYAVRCRSGNWGPDGRTTVFLGAAGAVAMPWYDGGLLKLVR